MFRCAMGASLMSHRVHTKIFIYARLFTACAALLLLTSTVLQRNDPDGYQATHLFFMPRQTWEMDGGVGMLHDPDYYASMDMAAIAVQEPDSIYQANRAAAPNLDSAHGAQPYLVSQINSSNAISQREGLSKSGPLLNFFGNTIPVEQIGATYSWELSQSFMLLLTVIALTIWLGDIPTPPPRRFRCDPNLTLVRVIYCLFFGFSYFRLTGPWAFCLRMTRSGFGVSRPYHCKSKGVEKCAQSES